MRRSTVKRRIIRRRRMDPHTARPTNSPAMEKISSQYNTKLSLSTTIWSSLGSPVSRILLATWHSCSQSWGTTGSVSSKNLCNGHICWQPGIVSGKGSFPLSFRKNISTEKLLKKKTTENRCFLFFHPAEVIPSQKALSVHTVSFSLVVVFFLRVCH